MGVCEPVDAHGAVEASAVAIADWFPAASRAAMLREYVLEHARESNAYVSVEVAGKLLTSAPSLYTRYCVTPTLSEDGDHTRVMDVGVAPAALNDPGSDGGSVSVSFAGGRYATQTLAGCDKPCDLLNERTAYL